MKLNEDWQIYRTQEQGHNASKMAKVALSYMVSYALWLWK